METFLTFPSSKEARIYRHEHGTGGWIFEPAQDGPSILFPPEYTPTHIFRHPFTMGKSGRIIGNA